METIGVNAVNEYRISTYDMALVLSLNSKLGFHTTLWNDFYDHFKVVKSYTDYTIKDWMESETDVWKSSDLCIVKPISTELILIIVGYDFFAELSVSMTSTKWIDQVLDYLYANFGEEIALKSPLLPLKFFRKG